MYLKITLDEMLASPDVRAGRVVYKIFQVATARKGVVLVRALEPSGLEPDWLDDEDDENQESEVDEPKEGEMSFRAFDTFSEAVDAMERDSVEMAAWYGQPVWLRKPNFKLNTMVDRAHS